MFTHKKVLFSLLALFTSCCTRATAPPQVELKKGLVIKSSVFIKTAFYVINGTDSLNEPVIIISGNNITVDFNNAELHGSNDRQLPNRFYGLALLIKGNNITLKHARISGYKVAVMACACRDLRIEYSDFSYNFRQHLQSDWLKEDVSDWMSYHHNEQDEWLRYGAGIYLKDCTGCNINNNKIIGGQCGLMMMRCNEGMIFDNDFSFNSGIGIGLYRSSRNNILHNKLDFNVRGYSHGFYYRGQDSAGILAFEQCNDNSIAFNSVTHSGDGFFLWAGQTTMDSGEGGCNGNVLYKNDFSYAPTNGVEVTFSRNTIRENIIRECDNGIWGGYSWGTSIIGNLIEKNNTGIAIEQGQKNAINDNLFRDNIKDGIKLWARKTQPPDWGYANKRDTRSRDYWITNNRFEHENNAIQVTRTDSIMILDNNFTLCKKQLKTDTTVTSLVSGNRQMDYQFLPNKLPPVINTWKRSSIPAANFQKGRNQMRITEWGPYDFKYPIIFLKQIDSNGIYHFDVLGPKGTWRIVDTKDISDLSAKEGSFPASITARRTGTDVQLNAAFSGERFTDQFGKEQMARAPYAFSFRDFQPEIDWTVNWFSWDTRHDPNKDYVKFKTVFSNPPLKTEHTRKIAYTWWGEIGPHLPADSFATVAVATIDVKKGNYQIGVTADDLVKVFVDGRLVIDFWDVTQYKNDEDAHHDATVALNGRHEIRIEHVENSGYATLIFSLKPL